MNKEQKAKDHELYTRMDVGTRIAEAMNRRGVTMSGLAKLTGLTVRKIRYILAGDKNLTINEVAIIFSALNCRFDLVVTSIASDEWATKRAIEKLEKRLWNKVKSPGA